MARARAIRRVELVRVACADLLGLLDVTAVGTALTAAAAATIEASLLVARRTVTRRVAAGRHPADRFADLDEPVAPTSVTGAGGGEPGDLRVPRNAPSPAGPPAIGVPDAARPVGTSSADARPDAGSLLDGEPARIAVIAMGRLGGGEMSYGGDARTWCRPCSGAGVDAATAGAYATAVIEELVRLLAQPGSDPALRLDLGLRPEGRNGPVTRDLDGYGAYYRRWALGWEKQALLRARPVAGDSELADRFVQLADEIRYPAELPAGSIAEVVRLRDRDGGRTGPSGHRAFRAREIRPRRADGRRVGRPDPAAATRPRRPGAAGHRDARRAARTGRRRPARRCGGGGAAGRLAVRVSDPQRGDARAWRSRRRDPRTTPALDRVAGVLGYPLDRVADLPTDHRRAASRARHIVDEIFAREQA